MPFLKVQFTYECSHLFNFPFKKLSCLILVSLHMYVCQPVDQMLSAWYFENKFFEILFIEWQTSTLVLYWPLLKEWMICMDFHVQIRHNVINFIDVGIVWLIIIVFLFFYFKPLWHIKTSMLKDIFNFLLQDDMAGYMIKALSGFRYSYCYWLIFLFGELRLTRHLPPSCPLWIKL